MYAVQGIFRRRVLRETEGSRMCYCYIAGFVFDYLFNETIHLFLIKLDHLMSDKLDQTMPSGICRTLLQRAVMRLIQLN